MLKVVFVSNFLNHHQTPLSEALSRLTENNYYFIATEKMSEERKNLGYKELFDVSYMKNYDECPEECQEIIDNADVVIFGSAPSTLLRNRIKAGKIIFKYSERPLKDGLEIHKYLPRLIKWRSLNPVRKPIYLLSASAFAPSDYRKFGMFPRKKYKWGYFPKVNVYENTEQVHTNKKTDEILWAGRFLDWKRPMDAVEIAKRLKDDGYNFKLKFIGKGQEESSIVKLIREYGLENNVELLGSMPPAEVRKNMETAGIFLFTSNKKEGWGAVLNEAMNSCCAVVANDNIGAVPYLMNSKNGFTYKDGDINDLYTQVKYLLDNPEKQWETGVEAYKTMKKLWNADIAAERLVMLSKALLNGEKHPDLFESGPCSLC